MSLLIACTPLQPPSPTPASRALQLLAGYEAEIVVSGLQGPTQMIVGPDGRLWAAQLAGDEEAGTGQVIATALDHLGEKRVLLDHLFKPTGLAVLADGLWIASGRDLLRAPLSAAGEVGQPEKVLADLSFNGRSNGALTVSPEGRLIFETSGNRIGGQAEAGSAQLWELDPADPAHPRVIAVGIKNGYGHTFDQAGRLWATDVADDPVNGQPPPDELNLILVGADFGWPHCFGDQGAALNYGGTRDECLTTRAPVAVFPPHSTPTSVVPSPWEADILLVALWGPSNPSIMRVPFTLAGDNAVAGEMTPFVTGMQHPQHLLVLDDGSLLASDFETGIIYRITRR